MKTKIDPVAGWTDQHNTTQHNAVNTPVASKRHTHTHLLPSQAHHVPCTHAHAWLGWYVCRYVVSHGNDIGALSMVSSLSGAGPLAKHRSRQSSSCFSATTSSARPWWERMPSGRMRQKDAVSSLLSGHTPSPYMSQNAPSTSHALCRPPTSGPTEPRLVLNLVFICSRRLPLEAPPGVGAAVPAGGVLPLLVVMLVLVLAVVRADRESSTGTSDGRPAVKSSMMRRGGGGGRISCCMSWTSCCCTDESGGESMLPVLVMVVLVELTPRWLLVDRVTALDARESRLCRPPVRWILDDSVVVSSPHWSMRVTGGGTPTTQVPRHDDHRCCPPDADSIDPPPDALAGTRSTSTKVCSGPAIA
mmetsp:Transcript_23143/g.66313  ORF Transcript_23143/g.66313 Transcript_23143/m.66313 type:complete len:360 (-) Transcript_23143:1683-2762(-)